jgi:hypothetical protein
MMKPQKKTSRAAEPVRAVFGGALIDPPRAISRHTLQAAKKDAWRFAITRGGSIRGVLISRTCNPYPGGEVQMMRVTPTE